MKLIWRAQDIDMFAERLDAFFSYARCYDCTMVHINNEYIFTWDNREIAANLVYKSFGLTTNTTFNSVYFNQQKLEVRIS